MEKEKKRETWKEAKEKHGKNIGKNIEMEETQKHIKSIQKLKDLRFWSNQIAIYLL